MEEEEKKQSEEARGEHCPQVEKEDQKGRRVSVLRAGRLKIRTFSLNIAVMVRTGDHRMGNPNRKQSRNEREARK